MTGGGLLPRVRPRPVTGLAATASVGAGGPARCGRTGWLVVALGLFGAIIILELAAGPALRPPGRSQAATALAIPGAAAMLGRAQADPTELTQVAATPPRPIPLAFVAQALLDALVLATLAVTVLPRARFPVLGGYLAILLAGVVATVMVVGRLRFLVALDLSPPLGTITYLLRYGAFRRQAGLVVLSLLVATKAVAVTALGLGGPRPLAGRALSGLALSSLAAAAAAGAGYAFSPVSLTSITDALMGAAVALAAVIWGAVLLSRSMRRLG